MLRREPSRIVGHLAGKSDDAVLGDDVDGRGFQQRLGIQLGLNAGGDGVIRWFSHASAATKVEHQDPQERGDYDP